MTLLGFDEGHHAPQLLAYRFQLAVATLFPIMAIEHDLLAIQIERAQRNAQYARFAEPAFFRAKSDLAAAGRAGGNGHRTLPDNILHHGDAEMASYPARCGRYFFVHHDDDRCAGDERG